jgi:transcriptional regulator with XRE-family HTH domain
MTFSEILKAIRKELSISQEILARDLNVSFSSVSRWENSKSMPNRVVLVALKEYAAKNVVSTEVVAELNRIRT